MRKQTTSKVQSQNSTCRALGHDWMTTAATNWRTCKREQCRASERLVDGQWVSNAKLYRQHTPVVASGTRQRQPRQSAMWETGQHAGRTGR
jgi:hypothetical protein